MNCTYCNAESGDEEICTYCERSYSFYENSLSLAKRKYEKLCNHEAKMHKSRIDTRKQFVSKGIDGSTPYRLSESILVRVHDSWRKTYNLTTDTLFELKSEHVFTFTMTTQSEPFFAIRVTVDDIPHITKVTAEHRYCSKCHAYLELNDDNFYRYANGNFLARCRGCIKDERKDTYKQGKVHRFNRKVGG